MPVLPETHSVPSPVILEPLPRGQCRSVLQQSRTGEGAFGRLEAGEWSGVFLRRLPAARPWSALNDLEITEADWRGAFEAILEGVDGDWRRFKHDHSGTVAGGAVDLAGRRAGVVAKRPRRTRATQWAVDLFRPARARRSWIKTWKLFVRGLPTEVPLLVMERRSGLVVADNLVVFELVPGELIEKLDLDELPHAGRSALLRAVGETIRTTERHGFAHLDAKTSNWIAYPAAGGRTPVMIDCDGVRHHPAPGAGLKRFLKALARHPRFRAGDARDVCDGYAPGGWPRRVRSMHDRYAAPKPPTP